MGELRAALARLESALRERGAPIANAFRPGLSEQDVRDRLAADGLPAHHDLVAWWTWHDGAESAMPEVSTGPGIFLGGENLLVGPWHMPALADALRTRRWNLDCYRQTGTEDHLSASWVPVAMTDGAGDLCADVAAAGRAPLHVLDHETQFERRPAQFASLAEFAGLLVRVLEEGLVVPDPQDARGWAVDFGRLPPDLRRLAMW